ncbi:MAG TPA: histidine kinase [Puia sp.]|nr:histidine kinase [Puia sp.]
MTILFILLNGWGIKLHAQDEDKFQLYTASEGLSDNGVTGISQDIFYGYIWASTLRGLNRFDGRHFLQIHAGITTNSLPDETISSLFWLDTNRLAAYTGMGLHIISTLCGVTSNLIIPASDPKYLYKFNRVMATLSDRQQNIFILTRSGFYQYDSTNKLVFRYDYYTKEETETTPFAFGNGLFWYSDSEILLITIDGVLLYNKVTRQLQKLKSGHPIESVITGLQSYDYLIRQSAPGSFIIIKAGTDSIVYLDTRQNRKTISETWIPVLTDEFNWHSKLYKVNDSLFYLSAKRRGFFKMNINPRTGKISIDPERYFPSYLVNDFLIDRDQRLWVATSTGLLKESNNATSVRQISIPPDLLKQNPDLRVKQMLVYNNKIYVACDAGGGLLVFDKNTLAYLSRISLDKYHMESDNVFSIIQARPDTLLVGTNGPLFWLKASTGATGKVVLDQWDETHTWVSNLFKDRRGNIWVTTNDNSKTYNLEAGSPRWKRLDYDSGIMKKILTPVAITEDRAGNIWMAGHGICRINRQSGKCDLYLDSFPQIRFPRRDITTLGYDKNNVVWAGIVNNGLVGYDIYKRTFRHFTTDEGLPDNYIRTVYPLDDKLWIATATGIASLNLMTNKISRFGSDDGFSLLPISSSKFYYDTAKHYLYCGFTNRIIRWNPDSLLYSESPPSLFIESIRLLNDTTYYLPEETVTIPYRKNDITVTVGSVNYNDVSNQRIAYRIVNAKDISWQALTGDLINFNNLSPGQYDLQVKLYAANNRWPPRTKEMHIIIKPPFWRTAWFIVLISIMLLSLTYLIYGLKINAVRRTERAKGQLQHLKAEEYKNRLELEQISNYFSSSLSDKKNISDVLWDVAWNLIGRMGYEDCMIYMWNEDKTKMMQKAGHGPKGTPEALARRVFDVFPGQGVVGHVMITNEPVVVTDTRIDKRYRADEMFRLSEICVPIKYNGELLGIIDSEHTEPNYFKERDLKIFTTIAILVGNKLKQVESEHSLEVKREELASINEKLAEAQLTALQAQMNPHFIFNALNSIKRMILDNENRNASRYLGKFAQMIRLTLNHSKETFVTLQETIEYLHAYLDMEQLRFGSSFSYAIEKDANMDEEDISIPTLMIQPLAENAIWHGLMHKDGDKKIMIRFIQMVNMVTCSIEDNGIGIRKSEKMQQGNTRPHVGLGNLRNRIKIMNEKYDMNCLLDIIDLSDKDPDLTGTKVILRFKIINP